MPVVVLPIEPPGWRRTALVVFVAGSVAAGAYPLYTLVASTVVSRPIVQQHIKYVSPQFFVAAAMTLYQPSTTVNPAFSTYRAVKVFGALFLQSFGAAHYCFAVEFH